MIDKLVLHIPFLYEHIKWLGIGTDHEKPYVDIQSLPYYIKRQGNIVKHPDGSETIEDLKTCFESLPSSHSGMAFKVFENGMNCDPFVMIQCSPAKLLQGHNLFGFDDMYKSGSNMLGLLNATYPELFSMLDIEKSDVSEFDLNYSVFIENPENKKLFLDHLRYVSKGQTKNKDENYATTIYFLKKKSRLKKLKVYSKYEEMIEDIKKMKKKGFLISAKIMHDLTKTDRAKQAVRFEASIKKRFLERRGIPTNFFELCRYFIRNDWAYEALFNDAWKDIFEALEGQELTKMNDEAIYNAIYDAYHTIDSRTGNVRTQKVNRLFSFYQTMKILGFQHMKKITSNSAFHRNIADLRDVGISHSTLQNLAKDSGSVVIQMSRFIKIDFDKQVPEGYTVPADLFSDCA